MRQFRGPPLKRLHFQGTCCIVAYVPLIALPYCPPCWLLLQIIRQPRSHQPLPTEV